MLSVKEDVVDAFSEYREDETNRTILHLAAEAGEGEIEIELIELILRHGRFLTSAVNKVGNTALHIASELGNETVAELLLSRYNIQHTMNKCHLMLTVFRNKQKHIRH